MKIVIHENALNPKACEHGYVPRPRDIKTIDRMLWEAMPSHTIQETGTRYDEDSKEEKARDKMYEKWDTLTDKEKDKYFKMPHGELLSVMFEIKKADFNLVSDWMLQHEIPFEVIDYELTWEEDLDQNLASEEESRVFTEKRESWDKIMDGYKAQHKKAAKKKKKAA